MRTLRLPIVFALLALALVVPAPVQAIEATAYRTDLQRLCASNEPLLDFEGPKGSWARSVAGIKLWARDRRGGRSITYCLQVNNGYENDRGHRQIPSAGGWITLPRAWRQEVESGRLVVNSACRVQIGGYNMRERRLFGARKDSTYDVNGKERRNWKRLAIPEKADDRLGRVLWSVDCEL